VCTQFFNNHDNLTNLPQGGHTICILGEKSLCVCIYDSLYKISYNVVFLLEFRSAKIKVREYVQFIKQRTLMSANIWVFTVLYIALTNLNTNVYKINKQ